MSFAIERKGRVRSVLFSAVSRGLQLPGGTGGDRTASRPDGVDGGKLAAERLFLEATV